MDSSDRNWTNIRDRYYTLKPTRKPLYLNELEIEKATGLSPALHLLFGKDKIKEEFLYSDTNSVESLMNGIVNPSIIGVFKMGTSFYLLVHPMPKHNGWHDGSFITTQFHLLFSFRELVFMKGYDIMNSISNDTDIKKDLYFRLKAMGDTESLLLKYNIYEKISTYINIDYSFIILLKSLPFVDNPSTTNLLKTFILEIKEYMTKHKDFDFEKHLKTFFYHLYAENKKIAAYLAKYLKDELKRSEFNAF